MRSSRTPRSIHDGDTSRARRIRRNRKARRGQLRRSLTWALAVMAVLGVLLALSLQGQGGSGRSTLGQAKAGAGFVDVLIDGWSLATVGADQVSADAGAGAKPVTFTPVTTGDLSQLQASSPTLVQAALARVINGSRSLACDTSSCTADGKTVHADELAPGADGDGAMLLRGLGIKAGLYKAHVDVPTGGAVTLSAPGYTPLTLTPALATPTPGQGGLGDGFGQGRWLVAAGLGRFFIPAPAWLGAAEDRSADVAAVTGTVPADALAQVKARAPQLTAITGLHDAAPQASTWTPAQLTLATSPTKGCAAGIVCFPGTLQVTQTGPEQRTYVSATSGAATGVVAVDDRTVQMSLPAPIPQAGISGRLSGQVSLRLVTAALFSGPGLAMTDFGGLVATSDAAAHPVADVLAHVRLAGQTWTVSGS